MFLAVTLLNKLSFSFVLLTGFFLRCMASNLMGYFLPLLAWHAKLFLCSLIDVEIFRNAAGDFLKTDRKNVFKISRYV